MQAQGYVQGQHGQYGPRPSGQLFQGAGNGQFGGAPLKQPFPGQQGNLPVYQSSGGQQGNISTGQQSGGQPREIAVNPLFGGMQTLPVSSRDGSGTAFGSQGMGSMGGVITPDGIGRNQRNQRLKNFVS